MKNFIKNIIYWGYSLKYRIKMNFDSNYNKTIILVRQIDELNTKEKIKAYIPYLLKNYRTFLFKSKNTSTESMSRPIMVRIQEVTNRYGEFTYKLIAPTPSLTLLIENIKLEDKIPVYYREKTKEEEDIEIVVKEHHKRIAKIHQSLYKSTPPTKPYQLFKNYGQN